MPAQQEKGKTAAAAQGELERQKQGRKKKIAISFHRTCGYHSNSGIWHHLQEPIRTGQQNNQTLQIRQYTEKVQYFHIFAVAYTTYCCTLFRYTIPCSLWALCPHIASCHMIPCIRSFLSPTVLLSILYMGHFCPRKGMAKPQCCSHRSHTVRNYTAVLRASSPHW